MAKKTYRFEMRLDEEHYQKLSDLRAEYGTTATEAIERVIDEAAERARERRVKSLEEIYAMESFDDVPDIEELTKQLESTHDIPDPYRR